LDSYLHIFQQEVDWLPNGLRISRAATTKQATPQESYLRTRLTSATSRVSGVGCMRLLARPFNYDKEVAKLIAEPAAGCVAEV
jgi:hypothetical protein